LRKLSDWHRLTEKITLEMKATFCYQKRFLFYRFYPFGNDLQGVVSENGK